MTPRTLATPSRRTVVLAALALIAPAIALAADAPSHSAVTPVPRPDAWWQQRHQSFNDRAKQGNADLLFIGDSITQGWEAPAPKGWEGPGAKDIWAKYYGSRNAVNLGIGGDQTQHVLWRLENGNIDGIHPKAAVIMIGTNNSHGNSAQEIADGITAIVHKLHDKLPDTKVLLLAVFPRGQSPNPQREKLTQTNSLIAGLADNKQVFFLDIGPNLMNPDGTIYKEIMPDFLHLSPKGYEIWATSIEAKLKELMGEK